MGWLRRHGWWGLVAMSVTMALFGLGDIAIGAEADVGIPLALIGMTPDELRAESVAGHKVLEFFTRTQGSALLMWGVFSTAILVFAYRRGDRWAYWTMWLMPAWFVSIPIAYLLAGLHPGQPPAPPMFSGPAFAVLAVIIQLTSASRFSRPDPARPTDQRADSQALNVALPQK